VSGQKVNYSSQTVLNRNVKSQRILAKLCALDSEYIFQRTAETGYQQVGAPVSYRSTVHVRQSSSSMRQETPNFILLDLWPPISPYDGTTPAHRPAGNLFKHNLRKTLF